MERRVADPANVNWHLDKRVPLLLIGTILVQTIAVVSVLTAKNIQLHDHERRLDKSELAIASHDLAIVDWTRRATTRQGILDEHAARLQRLDAADASFATAVTTMLQQLARLDEQAKQLAAMMTEVRNELRQDRRDNSTRREAAPPRTNP